MKAKIITIIFSLIILIGGIIGIGFDAFENNEYEALQDETTGIIVNYYRKPFRSRRHSDSQKMFVVQYTIDNTTYQKDFKVSTGDRSWIGKEISVRYNKNDPEGAMILKKDYDIYAYKFFTIISSTLIFINLESYLYYTLKYKKRRKIKTG